jgi:hypothetical protein
LCRRRNHVFVLIPAAGVLKKSDLDALPLDDGWAVSFVNIAPGAGVLNTVCLEYGEGTFRVRYCGAGHVATCRTALWAAIEATGAELATAQGPDPRAWRADANRERIAFVPGLLRTTLRYANRPSGIQQLLSFRGHRPQR